MKDIITEVKFKAFEVMDELPAPIRDLMEKAIEARQRAYAPYSNFRVGAALLLENGEIVQGSNQENAAYPSGLCAERVALFYAGAQYPGQKMVAFAISAASDTSVTDMPIPPCGACRQSIAEYEIGQESPIQLYFMGAVGAIYQSDSLRNLLPFMFDKKYL